MISFNSNTLSNAHQKEHIYRSYLIQKLDSWSCWED